MIRPAIRYAGSKLKILPHLTELIERQGIRPGLAIDGFAGAVTVGRHLRSHGFRVEACDPMTYSFVLGRKYLEASPISDYSRLLCATAWCRSDPAGGIARVIKHLNELEPFRGFATKHYSAPRTGEGIGRRYFTTHNAERIDAIRLEIERWGTEDLITALEKDLVLAQLLEAVDRVANTMGHTNDYLSEWEPNALRPLRLEVPVIEFEGQPLGRAHQRNAEDLVCELDPAELTYWDPPYNHRQFSKLYHVYERIIGPKFAEVDPDLTPKTGTPVDDPQKSVWSSTRNGAVIDALSDLLEGVRTRHLIMSYSSAGILEVGEIEELMRSHGVPNTYARRSIEHDAFRGRNRVDNGNGKVTEHLHYVRMER
jgi:adenine-specific DNA-methyltransferase